MTYGFRRLSACGAESRYGSAPPCFASSALSRKRYPACGGQCTMGYAMHRRGDHRSPANFVLGVHSEKAQNVCSPRYSSAAKRCAVAALTEKSNFIGGGKRHRKLRLPPGGRWHAQRDGRRTRDVGFMLASSPRTLPPLHPALSLSHLR